MTTAIDYSHQILPSADFSDRHLAGTSFRYAYLHKANFKGADLRNCDFTGADLRSADFTDADIAGAVFIACDLTGSNLDGVREGQRITSIKHFRVDMQKSVRMSATVFVDAVDENHARKLAERLEEDGSVDWWNDHDDELDSVDAKEFTP